MVFERFHPLCYGHPLPEIIWFEGFRRITQNTSSNIIDSYTTHSKLTVSKPGDYTCHAFSDAGKNSTETNVEILIAPSQNDNISGQTKIYDAIEGSFLEIRCEVTGYPRPVVTWFNTTSGNLINLASGRHSRFQEISEINANIIYDVLRVENIDSVVDSEYKCLLENIAGKQSKHFHVDIFYKPEIEKSLKEVVSIEAKESFEESNYARLDCNVARSKPEPVITWFIGDELINGMTNPGKYEIVKNNQNPGSIGESLIIKNVVEQDTRQFRCQAVNQAGTDEHLIDFVVNVPPRLVKPQNRVMTVQQDESFKIGCPSYGKPTPRLVWYHDEGNFIIKGTDGDYLRTSLKVSQNITCAVENSVGKDQFTFFINVLRLPEVYITPNEERVRSRIGESVMLTCTAIGNPLPELNWVLSDGGLSNLRRYEKNLEQPLLLC